MRQRATAQTAISNRGRPSLASQVAALFAAGMKGIWRESSRAGTLFVENPGVTPVSPGSMTGTVLSLDQKLERGPELWTGSPVTINANWTDNGNGSFTSNGGTGLVGWGSGKAVVGRTYDCMLRVVARSAGTANGPYDGAGGNRLPDLTAPATYQKFVTASATGLYIYGDAFAGTVDSISFREVLGNHQRQATTQSRPLYQTSPPRPVFDGVDDSLVTTFAEALGANCTVGRYVPGTGVVISEGVNIGTTFSDDVTSGPLLVGDRALTASEKSIWAAYLTQQGTLP